MDSSTLGLPIADTAEPAAAGGASPARWWPHISLRRDGLAVGAIGVLLVLVLSAISADALPLPDPLAVDVSISFLPPAFLPGGRPDFLLGTDSLGRDVLSRLVHGGRISLVVGFSTVMIGGTLGLVLGLCAGYYGGWVDNVIMRLADAQLAIPFVLLAIAVISVLGPNLRNLIIVLAVSSWVLYARLIRGEVLSIARREYVEAARMIGVSDLGILARYVLPNVINPLLVVATFSVAQMILAEAALSYLGLGVQPPTPTWGSMLNLGQQYLILDPWLTVFPGLAIVAAVLATNILGDWLRDRLDPRLHV